MPEIDDELAGLVDGVVDSMVDTRRDLHRHPELGFDEHRTTGVITDRLDGLGLTRLRCPTPTGAIYALDGATGGRTVLLRADIDALPVDEAPGDPVRSAVDGLMHACGHDAHTAAMLGVAAVLASRRDELAGRFVFVFQPAEEALGGAKAMVDGGVLDDIDPAIVLGCHVTSMAPVGVVATRAGVAMAEVHSFTATARGAGGHGAIAGTAGNVVLAISSLAGQLASVADGLVHDGTACACSAGMLRAGTAPNVVPSEASLRGTLRTFTAEHTTMALDRLRAACAVAADAYGCEVELDLADHAPAVVNDAAATELVRRSTARALGEGRFIEIPPVTPSDDVSEFMRHTPGCYFFVGAGKPDGTSGQHHSPSFSIDEECLSVAARVLTVAAAAAART